MRRIIYISSLTLIFYACERLEFNECDQDLPPAPAWLTAEKANQIINAVCNILKEEELLGLQVSIRDSSFQEWSFSVGTTDLKQTTKLENHHVLRVGSVTKIYTATLILRLVEEGLLDLDQNLGTFFPELEQAKEIRLRHLLNHSSGIVDIFSTPSLLISSTTFPDKRWDAQHLAETYLKKTLQFSPGSQNAYSNTNFIILGLVAERATEKSIDELFSEYIIKPLGLQQTYLTPYMGQPEGMVNGYVHNYALSLQEWYTMVPENTAWSTLGFTAGAMATTASDLSAFTHQLFVGDFLSTSSLNEMTQFSTRFGLGLFQIKLNDQTYWGHEGEITGFEALTVYHPKRRNVISICSNTTPFQIQKLLHEIDLIL